MRLDAPRAEKRPWRQIADRIEHLHVLATVSDAPIGEVIRGILPFLILLLMVLGLIAYVPVLPLWLPGAVYGN